MLRRREFLKQSVALAAASSLSSRAHSAIPAGGGKRNLLFITVDDMNWSLPGFMGNGLGLTPNLDSLASRSHRFVKNRGTAPICQPSREAMMTGRVPHRSGGLGFDPIHEGIPTMVTVLQGHGYYAAGIHKLEHMQPDSCFPWNHAVPGKDRLPSEYGQAVADAIAQARAENKPFFINCNINDPHRPFYGSAEAAQMDHHETGEYHVDREITAEQVTVPPLLEDLPEIRTELAQYYNSAQRMDISIGKVLSALHDSPEAANTIVFFSADHGMPFPFSKATVYDYGTRTPALLSYPGMSRGRSFEDRTCNVDYMPTLLDLLGISKPDGMDGHSWLPIMETGKSDVDRTYLVTNVNGVSSGAQYPSRAIQDDRYSLLFMPWSDGKLRLHTESMSGLTFPAMQAAGKSNDAIEARVNKYVLGTKWALYDLHEDPGQRNNLIDAAAQQERVRTLKQLLRESMVRTGDPQLGNFDRLSRGEAAVVPQPEERRRGPE